MRALAIRHKRLADLALSFPTLLFALAVPRRGLDPACAIGRAIDGAALAEVAAAADVPVWLRKLPPEALARRLATLPDSPSFRYQIANHLPSRKNASTWLQAVSDMSDLANETAAIWIARETVRDMQNITNCIKWDQLRLVGLWAWFSTQPEALAYGLIHKRWTPDVQLRSALDAAYDWRFTINLHVHIGRQPTTEVWLRPKHVCGYDFEPLASASDIAEEAIAMSNCLRTYGNNLAHNRSGLWSMRRNGQRVATLEVAFRHGDPLLNVVELKGVKNSEAPVEVWWAARQWLHLHDLPQVAPKQRPWDSVSLDRAA